MSTMTGGSVSPIHARKVLPTDKLNTDEVLHKIGKQFRAESRVF